MNGDGVSVAPDSNRPAKPEVAVVTEGSAGGGRAVVRRFAAAGAPVGIIARGIDGLRGAGRDVEKLGCRALILRGT